MRRKLEITGPGPTHVEQFKHESSRAALSRAQKLAEIWHEDGSWFVQERFPKTVEILFTVIRRDKNVYTVTNNDVD